MSIEQNKALVRRFFAFLNNKEHVNVLRDLIACDCLLNGEQGGEDALQNLVLMLRTAFPDEQMTIATLIAEGDYVAARIASEATHSGPWCSPAGVLAPTGKPVRATGMHFFRIERSQIVEIWTEWNVLGQMRQLGVVPALDNA